jgi:multicomponent Na+:H+ antiporter subunit B
MILFGVYVIINGHLTPGGGFQGGAIIASAMVLALLANPHMKFNHQLFNVLESISGVSFVLMGIAGIVYAGGFLDNRILPGGEVGTLISAGAIPLIYIFIGLKVGSELSNIVGNLQVTQNEQ